MAELKNKNSEMGNVLRFFFGLFLLPAEEVRECFLWRSDVTFTRKQDCNFVDYILETYIAEDCRFRPKMWAELMIKMHTKNCCESSHGKLHSPFTSAHPNIFLGNIKKYVNWDLHHLWSINERKRTKKQQRTDEYIDTCIWDYTNQRITRIVGIKKVGFKFI